MVNGDLVMGFTMAQADPATISFNLRQVPRLSVSAAQVAGST